MSSFVISLHNLRFYAAHGVYEEERTAGNEFEVNLSLTVKAPKETLSSIEQTINYADVHRIVKERFQRPTPLLETLAMELAENIRQRFPSLKKISVEIIKLHPPVVSFTGGVSVTYQKRYRT